jgi:NAD(P)H-nitrite reductase large subunit
VLTGRYSDRTIVCRCEEVTAADIRQAFAEGSSTINDVKRRTRAGMGVCQGIYCTRSIAVMMQRELGIGVEDIVPMTTRPPARVIPLAALAKLES